MEERDICMLIMFIIIIIMFFQIQNISKNKNNNYENATNTATDAQLTAINNQIRTIYNMDVEAIRNLGSISKSLLTGTNYHSTTVGTPGTLTIPADKTTLLGSLTANGVEVNGNITVGDIGSRGYIVAKTLISTQDTEIRGNLSVGGNVRFSAKNTNIMDILPRGIILIWFGSYETIPPGWVPCDGNGDVPDLKYNVVVGAAKGVTGWQNGDGGGVAETVIRLENLPPQELYKCPAGLGGGGMTNFMRGDAWGSGVKVHPQQASTPLNNRPPYKVLYYIMKG